MLIGQSIDPEVRKDITEFLEAQPEISKVLNLITIQLGEKIMVAVKAKMNEIKSADELILNINRCEAALKNHNKAVQWSFFEPDVAD